MEAALVCTIFYLKPPNIFIYMHILLCCMNIGLLSKAWLTSLPYQNLTNHTKLFLEPHILDNLFLSSKKPGLQKTVELNGQIKKGRSDKKKWRIWQNMRALFRVKKGFCVVVKGCIENSVIQLTWLSTQQDLSTTSPIQLFVLIFDTAFSSSR